MGRGKKKGDKKNEGQPSTEAPSLDSLSIGDQPSTSTAPEDGGGLTGGAPTETSAAAPTETSAAAPTETSAAAIPQPEEDEGGLGLDIGGARKKRPRKKKAAVEPQSVKPAESLPIGVRPTSFPPAQTPGSTPCLGQPAPAIWSHGPPPDQRPAPALTAQMLPVPTPLLQGTPIGAGFDPNLPISPPTRLISGDVSRGRAQEKPVYVPVTQSQAIRPPVKGPVPCRRQIPTKVIGRSVRSTPVTVLTNYLPMTIQPLKIYRYDVTITPERPKKIAPLAFVKAKAKLFPTHVVAFDQTKNCYALQPLPNVSNEERFVTSVEVQDNNGKMMPFAVSFKMTGIVDLGTIIEYMKTGGTSLRPPTEAIQCIDVILRQGTLESYVKAGRQFFKRPSSPIYLGDGLEMWTGLFQSAIFTSRPFINIDVAHKGFPKHQPLVDTLRDFRLDLERPLEEQRGRGVDAFLDFIKGLRVIAAIGGDTSSKGQTREFICNDLKPPANRLKFPFTDASGKQCQITVADYFAKKNIRLRYPNLNCMWVGPKDKSIYYPIELLKVAYGQARNKQLNEMQLSTMVREAATPPAMRKAKIEEVINDMKYSQNSYFKQFGLDIKTEFTSVQAKVLMPPNLEVGGGQCITPRKGVWQANKLLKAETLDAWAFLALDCDHHASNAETIIGLIKSMGTRMGMRVSSPKLPPLCNVKIHDLTRALHKAVDLGVKFIVVVVGQRGKDYYHKVKQIAERDVGILTQCIRETTAARRMNDQTIRNILLKMNSKLMGVNQAVDNRCMPKCMSSGGVMIVGADVTHPSSDQSSVPSIAAVTASMDGKCFAYNIALSIQTPKKEMIVEFEEMVLEHLKVYRDNQKTLPKKIYVFRDGVSEGQFAEVMNSELQAVHNAYKILAGPQAKVEVLFILVQKRHHTRFFRIEGSKDNVEPGTVVDTDIVHARELDFYLVSHHAIKGTARPTRYHAVCNDGNIPHDEVEQLAYYLCHLYSRCMRSVSYPTPTYYAHLACLRARSLTHGISYNNADLEKQPQRLRVMDKILTISRMFFV